MQEGHGLAQVLAVISGKGGTGKTSLCAGVASCLAMEGRRVLCVDLDVGLRNLDIALGMSDMAVLPFTSVMRGEYSLQQVSQHPTIENLALLTAPVTEDAETVDTETFGKLLAEARGSYDWILLDAPAGVGSLFRMAIRFADEAMLVTLAGPASQRDAARTAELLRQERQPAFYFSSKRKKCPLPMAGRGHFLIPPLHRRTGTHSSDPTGSGPYRLR